MASSLSNTKSTTKSTQTTNSQQRTSQISAQQSGSHTEEASYGGSHSVTNSHSEYGSDTYGSSQSRGGANSQTFGKSGYTGTVDDYTAAQRQGAMQSYEQSPAVKQAYEKLMAVETGKPVWQSQYEDTLKNTYDRLMNYGDFSYNYNEDPIWQAMKGTYTQQGREAMQDTMGQAAALSGGYTNSYAQTAAQQQYQNYLQRLNNQIPELRNEAFTEWQAQQQNMKDKFSLTNQMNENDYNKYRNAVADWQQDRAYAQSAYQYADAQDYNRWNENRNFWNDEYWKERAAETSNYSNTDESNWQNTESQSHTRGWENTNSVTDSTNWQNTVSDTSAWQLAKMLQNVNSHSVTNGMSSTNSSTSSHSSGSGSSGGGKSGSSKSSAQQIYEDLINSSQRKFKNDVVHSKTDQSDSGNGGTPYGKSGQQSWAQNIRDNDLYRAAVNLQNRSAGSGQAVDGILNKAQQALSATGKGSGNKSDKKARAQDIISNAYNLGQISEIEAAWLEDQLGI